MGRLRKVSGCDLNPACRVISGGDYRRESDHRSFWPAGDHHHSFSFHRAGHHGARQASRIMAGARFMVQNGGAYCCRFIVVVDGEPRRRAYRNSIVRGVRRERRGRHVDLSCVAPSGVGCESELLEHRERRRRQSGFSDARLRRIFAAGSARPVHSESSRRRSVGRSSSIRSAARRLKIRKALMLAVKRKGRRVKSAAFFHFS